ncbi:uncharacterized protein LOC123538204 [Mercenaria mercenaria]|uniref:uncharacterized protein LOC123538204 n=1 Tax=Mercenaria mercenaria TaxID=6596 RepID=UPI00234FAAE4|nr:uncharacterized protein LOC123538204 [Mercenaria mercenaria]
MPLHIKAYPKRLLHLVSEDKSNHIEAYPERLLPMNFFIRAAAGVIVTPRAAMGQAKHFMRLFYFILTILIFQCRQSEVGTSKPKESSTIENKVSGKHKPTTTSKTSQEMEMKTVSSSLVTKTIDETTIRNKKVAHGEQTTSGIDMESTTKGMVTNLLKDLPTQKEDMFLITETTSGRTEISSEEQPAPFTSTSSLSTTNPNTKIGKTEKVTSISDESLKAKIRDNIDILCPTGRVCREESIGDPLSRYRHCCQECSCDTGCGHNNQTCCFANDAVNKGSIYFGPECLHVTTSNIARSERHNYISYLMEAKCPPHCSESRSGNGSCGEDTVAPWGSLYPVYSQSVGKIFKNMACAQCNDITDGVTWDALMVCNMYVQNDSFNTRLQNIDNFQSFLNGYNPEELCYINFKPPVPFSSLEKHQCLQEPIKTCSYEDFYTPESLTLSREEIIKACMSDFVSPYTMSGPYSNVFCHICNNELLKPDPRCRAFIIFPREVSNTKFTTLLDKTFLDQYTGRKIDKSKLPMACISDKECRIIHCPSGKTSDRNGDCIFPSADWNVDIYEFVLRLEPENPIPVEFIIENSQGRPSAFDMSKLISPLQSRWVIKLLSYKKSINSSTVDNFVASIRVKNVFKNPASMLKAIEKYMKKKWYLNINETRSGLLVGFSEMRRIVIENNIVAARMYEYFDEDSNLNGMKWNLIHTYLALEPSPFVIIITKMFYCHQLELYPGEFELRYGDNVLYYKDRDKYFFDGEFAIVTNEETELQNKKKTNTVWLNIDDNIDGDSGDDGGDDDYDIGDNNADFNDGDFSDDYDNDDGDFDDDDHNNDKTTTCIAEGAIELFFNE